MKKTLLVILASAAALTSVAQGPYNLADAKPAPRNMEKCQLSLRPEAVEETTPKAESRRQEAAPRYEIITEVPGEPMIYATNGYGFLVSWGGIYEGSLVAPQPRKVYYDGNDVYVQSPVLTSQTTAYIKGYLSDDGSEIHIPAGQAVYYDDWSDVYFLVYPLIITSYVDEESGEKMYTYQIDDLTDEIVIYRDGDNLEIEADYNMPIGLVYDPECVYPNQWSGYATYDMEWNLFTLHSAEIPQEARNAMKSALMTYQESYSSNAKFIDYGVYNDTMYLHGVITGSDDDWILGHIDGNQVTFAPDQYLGTYDDIYFIYFAPGTKTQVYDEEWDFYYEWIESIPELVCEYDAATGILSSPDALAASAYPSDTGMELAYYTLGFYYNPVISYYEAHIAIPQNPVINDYMPYDPDYGWGYFSFDLSLFTEDGYYLIPENLYYRYYINEDEPLVLTPDLYPGISEPMEVLPYSFYDNYYIFSCNLYFQNQGVERMGVQAIYRYGDEERCTDIVYNTGDVSGHSAALASAPSIATAYYDLNGRLVSHPSPGLYIKRTTYSDGTTTTKKILLK